MRQLYDICTIRMAQYLTKINWDSNLVCLGFSPHFSCSLAINLALIKYRKKSVFVTLSLIFFFFTLAVIVSVAQLIKVAL